MHKAVRPSNYFFQFFHIQSGRADKDRSNLCPNFDRNTPEYLNTVVFIFKVGQLFTHLTWYPQQTHDFGLTSMRRDDVTKTSVRHHFNVMHLQGSNVVFVL